MKSITCIKSYETVNIYSEIYKILNLELNHPTYLLEKLNETFLFRTNINLHLLIKILIFLLKNKNFN